MKQSLIQLLKRAAGATLLGAALLTSAEELPRLPGTIEPDLRNLIIKDVHGADHKPLAAAGQKATVFFFVLSDCPIANSYAPEINRIVADYAARGVRSYVVYVEDDLSSAAAHQHARDHEFKFPALLDPEHRLVKIAQVTVSPEVAVFAPDNTVLYRGRIDDRAAAFGKRRVTPSKRDLRLALDAILDGKPVATPLTKAVGCYITTNENGYDREWRSATVAASILVAVEGGHPCRPERTLDIASGSEFPVRWVTRDDFSAGLGSPALRQAGMPAATVPATSSQNE